MYKKGQIVIVTEVNETDPTKNTEWIGKVYVDNGNQIGILFNPSDIRFVKTENVRLQK